MFTCIVYERAAEALYKTKSVFWDMLIWANGQGFIEVIKSQVSSLLGPKERWICMAE
jgi:hypothetical protein